MGKTTYMNRSDLIQFYAIALCRVLHWICGMQFKWEAKLKVSWVFPHPTVTIILYEKKTLFWCIILGTFAMKHQLLSKPCSKENDGVIWHFMTSEHSTSRYVVLHGIRSHTSIYILEQSIMSLKWIKSLAFFIYAYYLKLHRCLANQ